MIVYKFGGTSIKNAEAILKMAEIVNACEEQLILVASAMGKTTNRLEKILDNWFHNKCYDDDLYELIRYHEEIIHNLFEQHIPGSLSKMYEGLRNKLQEKPSLDFNYEYDQIVSYGEFFSTRIIASFLSLTNTSTHYIDIRNIIKTDRNFRDASVIWDLTEKFCRETFTFEFHNIYLTQGFIGGSTNNQTTTLGREGSDYSAAILANCCNAEKLVVWKDVPGIMNADPDWFPEAQKIETLSYPEAIELTYYGAKVIHPKTIKPLQEKNIPLWVNSFLEPNKDGTLIAQFTNTNYKQPVYIKKQNQVLISIRPTNAGFITDNDMSKLFSIMGQLHLTVQLTQMSASSFTVCVDNYNNGAHKLIESLKDSFEVRYNNNVEIITIRNYTSESVDNIRQKRPFLIEQKTRKTAQFVVVENDSTVAEEK